MARRPSRSQRRQARSEARLRFGPEEFALSEMLRDLIEEREASIGTAEGTARGIRLAARQADPKLRKLFGDAGKERAASLATLDATLSGLGSASAPFQAAITRERAGAGNRLSETLTNALAELQARELEAESGRAFAVSQAQGRYSSEAGKVKRRQGALAGERGAFTQGRVAELVEKEAERQFEADEAARARSFEAGEGRRSRRNARVIAGVDEFGNVIPGGPADPKATGKGFKRGQEDRSTQRKLVTGVRNALDDINRGLGQGIKKADIIGAMKLEKIPNHIISAAWNIKENGYLGPNNERRLRGAGLYAVPREWKPPRRRIRRPGNAPYAGGRGRPT